MGEKYYSTFEIEYYLGNNGMICTLKSNGCRRKMRQTSQNEKGK